MAYGAAMARLNALTLPLAELMMASGLADTMRIVRTGHGTRVELVQSLTRPVALLRAVLPDARAGGLAVRGRWVDAGVMALLGAAVAVLASTLRLDG